MSDYTRLPTSAEVYAVIMAKHRDQMAAFGSFSDPEGTFNGGPGLTGRMDTTWGISGTDFPLLEIETQWEIDPNKPHKRVNQRHEYFLCFGVKE